MAPVIVIFCLFGPANPPVAIDFSQVFDDGNLQCPFPDPVVFVDPIGDTAIRRTDLGGAGPVGEPFHNAPDIFAYRIGNWQPTDPVGDPYTGCWEPAGHFVRFDLAFNGLVNPPGLWALSGIQFDPYLFGPHPVFGYISFDVDRNFNSGGDLEVAQFRFPGSVARFGGLPGGPRFANRVARGGEDNDANFGSPPFIERSGEDFHLALFGDLFAPGCVAVTELVGNGDCTFDQFETWVVTAPLFHRAHGYEPFSGAGGDGLYEPTVELRFESGFGGLDITVLTLVYPLNNLGAAEMTGSPLMVEPMDGLDFNQNSVQEGLQELVDSVQAIPAGDPLRSAPGFVLIAPWETQDPAAYLLSDIWDVTVFVSMSYEVQDPFGDVFVWTDAMPGPKVGDFDGNGLVSLADVAAFDDYILTNDGVPGRDLDVIAGTVTLPNFAQNFSMFDLNYDGVVGGGDRGAIVIRGDMDGDFDIDLVDASILVQALLASFNPPGILLRGDVNEDGLLDGRDIEVFVQRLLAPP